MRHSSAADALSATIRLHFVGDIMLFGRYDTYAEQQEAAHVFNMIAPTLQEADYVIGNMECVLTHAASPRNDKLCLQGHPAYAPALRQAGLTHLGLANNHSFDFGTAGFQDTRAHLEAAGIVSFGAGHDLATSLTPVFLSQGDITLGMLAACDASTKPAALAADDHAGAAPLIIDELLPRIQSLRQQVDHVIVMLHWGFEYSEYPTPEQAIMARQAIDAGASVVIGHHSHMLQGIEHYQGGVIAYSLGNFTDAAVDWQGPERHYQSELTTADRESIILGITFSKQAIEHVVSRPIWLSDTGQPQPADAAQAARISANLEARSQSLDPAALEQHWQQAVVSSRVFGPLLHWWQSGSLLDKLRRFNLGQLKSGYLLLAMFIRVKLSRSQQKWSLLNPRNDTRPMPSTGQEGNSATDRSKRP